MKFKNYDLVLITDAKQREYFLGFQSSAGYLMFNRVSRTFVVDKRYYYAALKKLEPRGFYVRCGHDFSQLVEAVDFKEVSVLGIDFSVTTVETFMRLRELLPDTKIIDVGEEIREQMCIKSREEIGAITRACRIAEKSFKEVLKSLKEGVTEREIAAELEHLFKKNGASDKSFDTIIAFGANSAVPHHETGTTRLHKNMPVLMDFGCIYRGYCSDMTRTLWFGDKPSEKFLNAYEAVYQAHINASENIVQGMNGGEADALARDILTKKGYGQYFTHSLGHGIGVNIHEEPRLAPRQECLLLNGMVFSNEPGVYFDGKFGIRIEDSVYMQDGKVHSMMQDDKKLIIVKDGKVRKFKG